MRRPGFQFYHIVIGFVDCNMTVPMLFHNFQFPQNGNRGSAVTDEIPRLVHIHRRSISPPPINAFHFVICIVCAFFIHGLLFQYKMICKIILYYCQTIFQERPSTKFAAKRQIGNSPGIHPAVADQQCIRIYRLSPGVSEYVINASFFFINSRPKDPGPQLLAIAEDAFCR